MIKEESRRKTIPYEKLKNSLSPRQCTVPQMDEYDGEIERIILWMWSNHE